MTQSKHWTAQSPKKFAYRIASDFMEQMREAMQRGKWSQKRLAKKLGVSPGRISQALNNPGNLGIETMIEWARALGMKVTILAYDDGDKDNHHGPINPEVFRWCWEHANRPADMWAVETIKQTAAVTLNAVDLAFDLGIDLVGYSLGNNTIGIQRKPCVTSGLPGTEITGVTEIQQSKNTSRNDRIAARLEVFHG